MKPPRKYSEEHTQSETGNPPPGPHRPVSLQKRLLWSLMKLIGNSWCSSEEGTYRKCCDELHPTTLFNGLRLFCVFFFRRAKANARLVRGKCARRACFSRPSSRTWLTLRYLSTLPSQLPPIIVLATATNWFWYIIGLSSVLFHSQSQGVESGTRKCSRKCIQVQEVSVVFSVRI